MASGSNDNNIRIWYVAEDDDSNVAFDTAPKSTQGRISVSIGNAEPNDLNDQTLPVKEDELPMDWSELNHFPRYTDDFEHWYDMKTLEFEENSGWFMGTNAERVLWIPASYRDTLWLRGSARYSSAEAQLIDVRNCVHGTNWAECWIGS